MLRTGVWGVVTRDCYNFNSLVPIPRGKIVFIYRSAPTDNQDDKLYSCFSDFYSDGDYTCLYIHEDNLRAL